MPLLKHTKADATIVECVDGERRHVGENDVFECTDSLAKSYLSNYPERFVKADTEKPSKDLKIEPNPVYSQSANLIEVTPSAVDVEPVDAGADVSKLKNKTEVLEAIQDKAEKMNVHPEALDGVDKMTREEMEAFYNDESNFEVEADDENDESIERISTETIGAIQR